MCFAQQVAFLVRIFVRKHIKRKKVKKPLVFMVKNFTVIVFEDYFFKNLQRKRFFENCSGKRRPAGDRFCSRFVCVSVYPLFDAKWEPLWSTFC